MSKSIPYSSYLQHPVPLYENHMKSLLLTTVGFVVLASQASAGLLLSAANAGMDAPARNGGANATQGFPVTLGSETTTFQSGESAYVAATLRMDNPSDFTTIDNDGDDLDAQIRLQLRGDGATNTSTLTFGFRSNDGGNSVSLFINSLELATSFSYGTDYRFVFEITSLMDTGASQFDPADLGYAINPAAGPISFISGLTTSGNMNGAFFAASLDVGYRYPTTWGDGSGTTDVNLMVRDLVYADDVADVTVTTVIPEPSTLLLSAVGLGLLAIVRRHR